MDGTLDPALCEDFEGHLAGCDPCTVVIDNIRKTIQLYKGAEVYEVPMRFKERLHETLRARWAERKSGDGEGGA